jgi:hypothetical protein
MQASEDLTGDELVTAQNLWIQAARQAADLCEGMANAGVHKQICNRLIEPYIWVQGIISSTEWDNFYALRAHPDAQPEFQTLAVAMREAQNASIPALLRPGEWHLPYITAEDKFRIGSLEICKMVSAARCARVSYLKHDGGQSTVDEDVALFNRLVGSTPKHMSPVEHQATPQFDKVFWGGNFRGWHQFRQDLEI